MTDIIFLTAALAAVILIIAAWAKWVMRVIGNGVAGLTVFTLGIMLTTLAVCVTVVKS